MTTTKTKIIAVYTLDGGDKLAVIEHRRRGRDADHPPNRRWVMTEVGGQCRSFETVFAALDYVLERYSSVTFKTERVQS